MPANKNVAPALDTKAIVMEYTKILREILTPDEANPGHEFQKINEAVRAREIINIVKNSDGSKQRSTQDPQLTLQKQH